jgi:Fungal protein kinase
LRIFQQSKCSSALPDAATAHILKVARSVCAQLVKAQYTGPLNRTWDPHDKKLIGSRRKPDLAMNSEIHPNKELNWKTLASVCEIKYRTNSKLENEARIQIADKAFFTLSSQLNRRYFVGITLCGPKMRVLVFTRGGSAVSSPIDVHENPRDFLYVLGVFAAGNLLWLGYDQHISVLPGDSLNLTYNGELYEIIQPLFMACSVQGRGT